MTNTPSRESRRVSTCATRAWACCLAAAGALLASNDVSAQTRFSAESLALSPSFSDSGFATWGTRTLEQGRFGFMLDASYARRPLTVRDSDSRDSLGDLVGSMSTIELMATAGVVDRLDVSLGIPLHRVSAGTDL